jgi:hypothetical protein
VLLVQEGSLVSQGAVGLAVKMMVMAVGMVVNRVINQM